MRSFGSGQSQHHVQVDLSLAHDLISIRTAAQQFMQISERRLQRVIKNETPLAFLSLVVHVTNKLMSQQIFTTPFKLPGIA